MEVEEIVLLANATIGILALEEGDIDVIQGVKRKHRYHAAPYLKDRTDERQRNTFTKLHRDLIAMGEDAEFKHTLRMGPDLYHELLAKVTPLIYRSDTNFRPSVKPNERLDITLRYLALGDSSQTLHHGHLVGGSTVYPIIRDTCIALTAVLRDEYMKVPSTTEEWLEIADGYASSWQVPHCIGSVDGKHIRIKKPKESGATFFNYKKFYSIVLMAVVDAQYRFLYDDVGSEGKAGDSRIWKEGPMHRDMSDPTNPLQIPPASGIKGMRDLLPYFMIGDDAFGLSTHLMKPYAVKDQGMKQVAYNYRMSRGRRCVENSFGIWVTRFRLFLRQQDMEPKGVKMLVMASLALHNFLHTRSPSEYIPHGAVDYEDREHDLHPGEWREEGGLEGLDRAAAPRNMPQDAKTMRHSLCEWFSSRAGRVPWQDRYLRKRYGYLFEREAAREAGPDDVPDKDSE